MLQALYSIRSERQLCEQLRCNYLYRWFVGLQADAAVWDPSTFAQNRKRFHDHGRMQAFFESSVATAIAKEAASCEEFAVDGTLIESWASMKGVHKKFEDPKDKDSDSNTWSGFQGQKLSNETHRSTRDIEARLAREGSGQDTELSHSLHVLMDTEN